MIARQTLGCFLLGLGLVAGVWAWSSTRVDECTAFLGGNGTAPATTIVQMGSRGVEVPCSDWLVRQPLGVQMVCLLGLVVGVIFLLLAVNDLVRWRRRVRGES